MRNKNVYTREYGEKRTQRVKKKNTVRFVTAFICFTLILGAVSFVMLWRHYGYDFGTVVSTTALTEESSTEPQTDPAPQGSATILFIHFSDDGKALRSVCTVNADAANGFFAVKALDVTVKRAQNSLQQAFVSGAITAVGAQLSACGTEYDRYYAVSDSDIINIIKYLGDLPFTLLEPIDYDTDELALSLPQGEQLIAPETVVKLIKYYALTGDSADTADRCAVLLTAALNAYCTEQNLQTAEDVYSRLINIGQSDISVVDFSDARHALQAFVSTQGHKPAYVERSSSRR